MTTLISPDLKQDAAQATATPPPEVLRPWFEEQSQRIKEEASRRRRIVAKIGPAQTVDWVAARHGVSAETLRKWEAVTKGHDTGMWAALLAWHFGGPRPSRKRAKPDARVVGFDAVIADLLHATDRMRCALELLPASHPIRREFLPLVQAQIQAIEAAR